MFWVLEVLNNLIRSKSIPLHIDTNSTSFLSLNMEGQPLTTGAIIMIAVCSIILLLVAVGTIVELLQPLVASNGRRMKKQPS